MIKPDMLSALSDIGGVGVSALGLLDSRKQSKEAKKAAEEAARRQQLGVLSASLGDIIDTIYRAQQQKSQLKALQSLAPLYSPAAVRAPIGVGVR